MNGLLNKQNYFPVKPFSRECGDCRGGLTRACVLALECLWPHLYLLLWLHPRATSPKAPSLYLPLLSAVPTTSQSLWGLFPGVWLQNEMSLPLDLLPFLPQRIISLIASDPSRMVLLTLLSVDTVSQHYVIVLISSPVSHSKRDGFLQRALIHLSIPVPHYRA